MPIRPVREGIRVRADAPAGGGAGPLTPGAAHAETQSKLVAAKLSMDRGEFNAAEGIPRQVVQTEPANGDALKALAVALCREDKLDESAAILGRLPGN